MYTNNIIVPGHSRSNQRFLLLFFFSRFYRSFSFFLRGFATTSRTKGCLEAYKLCSTPCSIPHTHHGMVMSDTADRIGMGQRCLPAFKLPCTKPSEGSKTSQYVRIGHLAYLLSHHIAQTVKKEVKVHVTLSRISDRTKRSQQKIFELEF